MRRLSRTTRRGWLVGSATLLLFATIVLSSGCAADWIANEGDFDTSVGDRIPLLIRGNSIWRVGPAGASPTLMYSDVAHPNDMRGQERVEIPYDPSQIEIVGWVETAKASRGLQLRVQGQNLDAIGIDGSDYGSAFRELMEFHDLDGLLNTTVDTDLWMLNLFFIRFMEQETRLGGVGYRFRDDVDLPWRLGLDE